MAESWTVERVAERFEEAADTLHRLPDRDIRRRLTYWPAVVRNIHEAYGWHDAEVRPAPPAPGAIDRMEETFGWLPWLEPEEVKLVWLRACQVRWKPICHRFSVGRTTAWQRWTAALTKVAARLCASAVHTA